MVGLSAAQQHRVEIGARVRLARLSSRLSQEDLGAKIGYSGTVISRIESGKRRAAQETLLAIARVTDTPPEHFGVLDPADTAAHGSLAGPGPLATLIHDSGKAGDVVQRREFLMAAAALAGADGAAKQQGEPAACGPQQVVAELDRVLFHPGLQEPPLSEGQLRRALTAAQQDFREARYGALGGRLPRLIAAAQAARDAAHGVARERADALVAHVLSLASDWCLKQNQDALAWVAADRALSAAHRGGQAAALGEAARTMAVAMRRSGHHAAATALLEQTAAGLDAEHGDLPAAELSVFGSLLLTAGYSAALGGARAQACDLLAEAEATAGRIARAHEKAGGLHSDSFGHSQVGLYGVSVHYALGEHGHALRYARAVRIEDVPTAERKARFFVDVGRAQHGLGNATGAYQALLAAEGCAPEDVRRPSVRALTADLLYTPRSAGAPAGLRAFAERTGALL